MYYWFILLIGIERLAELAVSRRNAKWSFAQGGREFGQRHYPVMVTMHSLLLLSCVTEVAVTDRPFVPWLGWPMVGVVLISTAVRWWCVAVLGKHWNPPADRDQRSSPGSAWAIPVAASPELHGSHR